MLRPGGTAPYARKPFGELASFTDAAGRILNESLGNGWIMSTEHDQVGGAMALRQAGSTSYGYDANGNMTSRGGSTIGYTSSNLPSVINAGSNSSTLSYGAYRNRYKQVAVTAGVAETTIYLGGMLEKVTKSGSITWLSPDHPPRPARRAS